MSTLGGGWAAFIQIARLVGTRTYFGILLLVNYMGFFRRNAKQTPLSSQMRRHVNFKVGSDYCFAMNVYRNVYWRDSEAKMELPPQRPYVRASVLCKHNVFTLQYVKTSIVIL